MRKLKAEILQRADKDPRLRNTELKVLRVLLDDFFNNQLGLCIPENNTIADIIERDVRTVRRCMAGLEKLGYLSRQARFNKKGKQISNYFVFPNLVQHNQDYAKTVNKLQQADLSHQKQKNYDVNQSVLPSPGQSDYNINSDVPLQCSYDVNQNVLPSPGQKSYFLNNFVLPGGTKMSGSYVNLYNLTSNLQEANTRARHEDLKINKKDKREAHGWRDLQLRALDLFAQQDIDQQRGRHIIGKLVNEHGSQTVADALQVMLDKDPVNAVGYLFGVLKGGPEAEPKLCGAMYRELLQRQENGEWLTNAEKAFMEHYRQQQQEIAKNNATKKRQQELDHAAQVMTGNIPLRPKQTLPPRDSPQRTQEETEAFLRQMKEGARFNGDWHLMKKAE